MGRGLESYRTAVKGKFDYTQIREEYYVPAGLLPAGT